MPNDDPAQNLPAPGLQTMALHTGLHADGPWRAVAPAITLTTVFQRPDDCEPCEAHVYSRAGAPNRAQLEEALAALEGGAHAFAFASGMAAINAVFQMVPHGSRVLVARDLYWGAKLGLQSLWPERLRVEFLAMDDLATLEAALRRERTALVWMETPSNPLMTVTDLRAACALARAHGALSAVDNTMATPVLQRPFELGADIVMHSTSKYAGGHSDLLGGALVTRHGLDAEAKRLREIQVHGGAVAAPFDCWIARRGLMTMPLRVRQHASNAMRVAEYLSAHPAVSEVYYAGLPTHPGHAIAKAQMHGGFGGVVSFRLRAGEEAAKRLPTLMHYAYNTTSLGGVESLIEHRRSAEGPASSVPADLVRFSVGIEDIEDILADLGQALARCA
jgi:cystathionine gamma-synthase